MTFYEAAIHVLEREGKPLTSQAITDVAVKENLLSHVGKEPHATMQSRLIAMAKRRGERRIIVVAPETFALVEWGAPEDPAAAAAATTPTPPEAAETSAEPLRDRERHPEPDSAKVRVIGRGERPHRKRRPEREDRRDRGRRLPPLADVAIAVLTQAGEPLSPVDIAAAARERGLVNEDMGAGTLLHAMEAENRRRSHDGRPTLFVFGANGEASIAPGAAEPPPVELQAAFASALGMPLRPAPPGRTHTPRPARGPGASRLVAQATEHRRQILRLLRRRLNDLEDLGFVEACSQLLKAMDFRDIRTARPGEGRATITARRRDGSLDVRYAVRLISGPREISREDVSELRKEVSLRNAQVGILVSPGDVTREARHEASTAGTYAVMWCGESLAEQFMDARIGAAVTKIEAWDLDEEYFRTLKERFRSSGTRTPGDAIPLAEVVSAEPLSEEHLDEQPVEAPPPALGEGAPPIAADAAPTQNPEASPAEPPATPSTDVSGGELH
jgi:ribonuclease E